MLLDANYCPAAPSAPQDDGYPFHMYLRTFGDAAAQCYPGLDAGRDNVLDTPALEPALEMLELDDGAPPAGPALDADSNLFVDAFQFWRQDSDSVFSGDSGSVYSSSPGQSPLWVRGGGLPRMLPGSRGFAAPRPASPQSPSHLLLHTGANVVDMVSGVTCSGVGLGAVGTARVARDVIGDLTSSTALGSPGLKQDNQGSPGSFGHLLRQRPASLSGDVRMSANQVVVRQRPHSEDLQLHQDFLDQDADEEDEEDDVFLDTATDDVLATARRHSSGDDLSDVEEAREEGGVEVPAECRWAGCGLQFAGRTPLVRHIEKVHVEPRRGEDFSCLWRSCPRGARPFNARYKLLIHMRVHSGE